MFDLADIKYVKRITVGAGNADTVLTEQEIQKAMDLLNKCLAGPPKGRIIGMEKSLRILNIGGHQAVIQWLVYHVGFARKPFWMEE